MFGEAGNDVDMAACFAVVIPWKGVTRESYQVDRIGDPHGSIPRRLHFQVIFARFSGDVFVRS